MLSEYENHEQFMTATRLLDRVDTLYGYVNRVFMK